ncbi:hypothetical protein HZA97_09115 [Candidatus Woesearchaeota archaeon]|nr:hypothetical protein [Candidatus Woesearchaeota archaeon]
MAGCDKCSGHDKSHLPAHKSNNSVNHNFQEDDCCGHAHSYTVETSQLGGKIFKYSITFMAGLTLAFFAFQPSRVYKMDINQDGVNDVVVERYFSGRRYFFKGVKEAKELEPLKPSDGLSWEVMNLRFEAEKELLKNK